MLLPASPSVLISETLAQVDAIKTAAGLTDQQFAALCMPVLRSYAEYVQRLPLSANAFSEPRGAWNFGLTAATVAYRYAFTVIFFPTLGAEERRVLEPQCRYMAFVAVLATAVATVVESGKVATEDDEYHPLCVDTPLSEWLATHRQNAKFSWRVPATPLTIQACAAIAAKFIPKGLLGAFDLRAVLMMYEAITPKATMNGVESTLARVVRETTQRVTDHYREKQAGTFQPTAEQGQVTINATDAEKVAKKLIAVANPKLPTNPLEPSDADGQASTAPSPSPTRAVHDTPPAQTISASPPATLRPEHTPPASAAVHGGLDPGQGSATNGDVLGRAHKVLREWFSALKLHPNFPKLKDQLEMTEEGITVPIAMLGMFGVSSASIRKMMDEAGLIVRRSDDARGVILHPGLRDQFTPTSN